MPDQSRRPRSRSPQSRLPAPRREYNDDNSYQRSKRRDEGGRGRGRGGEGDSSRRDRERERDRDRDGRRGDRPDYDRSRNGPGGGKDSRRDERDRDRNRDHADSRRGGQQHRSTRRSRSRSPPRTSGRNSANHRSPRSPPHSRPRSHPRSRSGSPSGSAAPPPPAKPNFGASGLLAAETNSVKHKDGTTTVLKYNEPPEARKPKENWRLYVFKGEDQTEILHIHRQSVYLLGRDRVVTDIPIDHPSCSKQHATIQYRQVTEKDEWGASKAVVKPFIIDLESTNGTHVNGTEIPTSRYYEIKAGDVIRFGQSTRDYVLLNEDAS